MTACVWIPPVRQIAFSRINRLLRVLLLPGVVTPALVLNPRS